MKVQINTKFYKTQCDTSTNLKIDKIFIVIHEDNI